jgi:RNA polymerase sigma-70 factor, ECF subfamily
MSDENQHDLAARLARGEEAAFAELYDASADRLYRYVLGRVGSPESAADVLQTAFLRAVKNRKKFRNVENPIAYLFQIARNEASRNWRNRIKDQRSNSLESVGDIAAADRTSDDADYVASALSQLSPDDRELVELKTYAGLTFREIGEIVGLPLATVATRYRRVLTSLRDRLNKQMRVSKQAP